MRCFYLLISALGASQIVQIFFVEQVSEEHLSESSSDSLSDLEELSQKNQSYRPYRDKKNQTVDEICSDEKDWRVPEGSGGGGMEPAMIRKKVKQSLAKKQQKARKTKRGEAGVVTRKRRENRSVIKQSSDGIW